MIKILFIFFLSSIAQGENAQNRFEKVTKYEYNVFLDVLKLKLGKASLSIKNPGIINGVNVYHFNLSVKTTKFGDTIYKIRNQIDVWVSQNNLNVLKQNKNIQEMRKKKRSQTIIKNGKAISNDSEFFVSENIFDPYSLILTLPEFKIPINGSRKFNIIDEDKSRVIEIKNIGTKMIRTPWGRKKGYVFSPLENGQPVLRNKGDMEISYVKINDVFIPAKITIKLQKRGVINLRIRKIHE